MKIVAARIRNFKLLREIDLSFSTDPQKPLTVIRAENGSGKTSTLQALRWALYGKDVLDEPLVRLSPADWPDNSLCTISVEIDFIHTAISKVDGATMTSETSYMLKREVGERPTGDRPNRGQERVILFEKTPAGADLIDAAQSRLAQMLPKEMIDIFFTDGDAAMTFISPQLSDSTKRDKVKDAIRSLLGLDLLERVEKRISNTQSAVNRKIAKDTSFVQLTEITEEIEETTKTNDELENTVTALKEQIEDIEKKLHTISRDLIRALEAGSYEQLAHQKENYKKQLEAAVDEEEILKSEHQELFQTESLSLGLLELSLQNGYDHLDSLHAKGIIPKAAVPILEERIDIGECICGTDLSEGTVARGKVCELIEQHRKNDGEVDYLSSLYYQSKTTIENWNSESVEKWPGYSSELQKQRIAVSKRIDNANRELKSVEAKLDQINEEEIEQKHLQEKMYTSSLRKKNNDLDRAEASLKVRSEHLKSLIKSKKNFVELTREWSVLMQKKQH